MHSDWCIQAERGAKLAEVATHEKQLQDIQNKLEQYAENDPDKINSMSRLLLSHLRALCCTKRVA